MTDSKKTIKGAICSVAYEVIFSRAKQFLKTLSSDLLKSQNPKEKSIKLIQQVNKLKDSYGSLLTDSRKIQSTCKSCQNQQRIQEENRALREQLQLMKGNLDKTKEERDSLQMVVSLLSKELYNFRPDSKEAFKESLSVDPKVSDTKGSDTKADTKQNNGSSKSLSSKTTKNRQSKSSKKKPPNKSSRNSSKS